MKRLFIVLTERKRTKGKISYYIGEIINNEINFIGNDFKVSVSSNRGLLNEAVNFLVKKKIVPSNCIDAGGYIDEKNKDFNIIHVESTDISYINFR